MRKLLVLLSFLVCAALAVEMEGDVHVLTDANFDSWVDSEPITLIEFYAPWCGHCKHLTPEYAKAATALKKNDPQVKLAKVDATVETQVSQRFGVTGYPTLKVFRNGAASEYKGPREEAGIVSYMQKQAAPSIAVLKTPADVEKFVQSEAGLVFFGETSEKLYTVLEKASAKHRETFRFGVASGSEVLEKYKHKNSIVLLQARKYTQSPLETAEVVFSGTTEPELHAFAQANVLPLVGEIHQDNQNFYSGDKPTVKVYLNNLDWQLNSKGINYVANRVRKIAKDYSDKFFFAVANKGKSQKEVDDFGLKGETPFAIHHISKSLKYPSSEQFSTEALKKLLDEYVAGSLESYIKSEEIPTQDPEGPVVVVGKTFDQIVNDPTKDVLIEAYAPWCGHCKTLEPKYKDLAQKMKKHDSVVIAKIDATANDLPSNYPVRGFPTILFAKANDKANPIAYDGARETKDMAEWIKNKAAIPLSTPKNKEEL